MQDLRSVYRRYALAFATFSIAICIGFVMQTSEASVLIVEEKKPVKSGQDPLTLPADIKVPQLAGASALPAMPTERGTGASLPNTPLLVAVADDLPIGLVPSEEKSPRLGCETDISAKTTAGALVVLTIDAPCHASGQVLIGHEGLQFQATLSEQGQVELVVPALSEKAIFSAAFSNGDLAETFVEVESLPFYDRVVLQWSEIDGPELHAREFGANYGEVGHVWREAPRAVAALAGGAGGFLMRLGHEGDDSFYKAEAYTFPTGIAQTSGNIEISIEAEVTDANCDREISLSSMAIQQGQVGDWHTLKMQMPDCTAVGEFLLLKNLVEDLTIAQN